MPQPTDLFHQALQGVLKQVAEPTLVLRTILDQAVTLTQADRGLFVEVAQDGALDYQVVHHFKREELNGPSGDFSRSIFARVTEGGEGVLLVSALGDAEFKLKASVRALRVNAILCMPIKSGDRVAALVYLEHHLPGHFTQEHADTLRSLIEVAGPVFETFRASREMLSDRTRLAEAEGRLRQEVEESRQVLARDWSFGRFVGKSSAVRELGTMVSRAAAADFPVLMLGETGTGKSILARVIHHSGPRAEQAFVTVFCPSLERGMVEAELFGHKKGTFTGALTDRQGKVQAADGGTLFLDEIGELPLEIQPKLLRLLQEKTYERVGDASERSANVRVIAATNRDLEQEVEKGGFRRDLYERLNYIPILIPPLRERTEDLPLLLRHYLDQHEAGRWIEISEDAQAFLAELDFAWPGNVRHIEQLAARLMLEPGKTPVTRRDLNEILNASVRRPAAVAAGGPVSGSIVATVAEPQAAPVARDQGVLLEAGLPALLEEAEKAWLEEALRRYPKLTRAELAEKLKISESGLYKKLRAYGLSA